MNCNISGPKQNCSVSDADPGGCIKRPNQCTDIDGVSCAVKPNAAALMTFLVFDVVSFGFSMALIVFVVACSIPQSRAREPAAAAGVIWLSLAVAYSLLGFAVLSGICAVMCAMAAVLPLHTLSWSVVWGVLLLGLITTLLAAGWVRLWALSPGRIAVQKALRSVFPGSPPLNRLLSATAAAVSVFGSRVLAIASRTRQQPAVPQGP